MSRWSGRARRQRGPAAPRRRARARLGLLLGAEAAARDEQLGLVGRQVRPEQAQVAGHGGHGAQQRVHVGGGHGRLGPRPARTAPATVTRMRRSLPLPGAPGLRGASAALMCLASSVIWLLTSTVRGSLSMAAARVSGVQRSSVSTDSAIDQPP